MAPNQPFHFPELKAIDSLTIINKAKTQLFGSYSRGEPKRDSDIDIFVQMKPSATLFDMAELNDQLGKKLEKIKKLI